MEDGSPLSCADYFCPDLLCLLLHAFIRFRIDSFWLTVWVSLAGREEDVGGTGGSGGDRRGGSGGGSGSAVSCGNDRSENADRCDNYQAVAVAVVVAVALGRLAPAVAAAEYQGTGGRLLMY